MNVREPSWHECLDLREEVIKLKAINADLLEALQQLESHLVSAAYNVYLPPNPAKEEWRVLRDMAEKARAAIAKATE